MREKAQIEMLKRGGQKEISSSLRRDGKEQTRSEVKAGDADL